MDDLADGVVICVVDDAVGLVLVDVGLVLVENVCVASNCDTIEDLTSLGKADSNTDSAFAAVGWPGRVVTAAAAPSPMADTIASMPALLTLSSANILVGRASVLAIGPGPRSLLGPRSTFDICLP